MAESQPETRRVGRFFFGGLASAGAACCTHPLDLLKVHLQTQQKSDMGFVRMGIKVVQNDGVLGLYNGLSASIVRQLTYSLTRFAIYETAKKKLTQDGRQMPFYEKVGVAMIAGATGGVVGTPGDLVNVRMQNDMKLPPEQRRGYKHAVDGLWRVYSEEGPRRLFSGATMASSRAVFVTVGQLSFYDQIKQMVMSTGKFEDNMPTHFLCSFIAGTIATLMTQPLDVMKTRFMNAAPGQYSNILACFKDIAAVGPKGFFKGFIPAWVRLGPHTILTFLIFEQLRLRFGYDEIVKVDEHTH